MRTPFLLPLALSWACSADYGAVGDADYGDDTDASPGDGPSLDTGSVFTPGETEDDRRWLRPAESDVFVFVANPANDTVTRVNARTLEVRTAQVGRDPSAVAVTPGWSAPATSRTTRSRICGLTDSTRISAARATSTLSPVTVMP